MTTSHRLLPLDVVRGVAILFVVVFHALLLAEAAEAWSTPWRAVVGLFRLLPIPTLLLVSGLLSASVVRSTRRTLVRAGQVLLVYLVWTCLFFGVFAVLPYGRERDVETSVPGLLHELVLPTTYLWYLYGLALLLLVVRLTRRLPTPLVVTASTAASVLFMSGTWSTTSTEVDDLLGAAVFFVVGARYRPLLVAVAGRTTRPAAAALVLLHLLLGVVVVAAELVGTTHTWEVDALPGVGTAVAALSVAGGLSGAWLVSRTLLGRALAALGRLSLPVYLGHELVLGLVVVAVGPLLGTTSGLLRHALPLLLTATAIALSLLMFRLLRRVPLLYGSVPHRWAPLRTAAPVVVRTDVPPPGPGKPSARA